MGYLHIDNLYKNQSIFLFRECYALEKIHGTSAHIGWNAEMDTVGFFSGEQYDRFVALFDKERLREGFVALGHAKLIVYGEAYGGKIQGASRMYGPDIKFVVFDVKHGERWLEVPHAHHVATTLGLEFVDYVRIPTDLRDIDCQRDRPSTQAQRNGMGEVVREGVVLRPIHEFTDHRGNRIIAKHKADAFRETTSVKRVKTDEEIRCLEHADEIAEEWVTDMRMRHVLQAMGGDTFDMKRTGEFIKAMTEDVLREASGEIVESKEARKAISAKAAEMYKKMIKEGLYGQAQ